MTGWDSLKHFESKKRPLCLWNLDHENEPINWNLRQSGFINPYVFVPFELSSLDEFSDNSYDGNSKIIPAETRKTRERLEANKVIQLDKYKTK